MKYSFVIRFTNTQSGTEQIRDLKIPLGTNFERDDTNKLVNVVWIKNVIRGQVDQCRLRRLRLIYNGRVLNENTNFKREIFDARTKQAGVGVDEDTIDIYIHCVVGDEMTREQLAQENQLDNRPQEVTTAPEVIGFDRLLLQGVPPEDVMDLRRQFLLIYGPETLSGGEIRDLEEIENHQRTVRALEERWIELAVNVDSVQPPRATGETNTTTGDTDGQTQLGMPLVDLDDATGNEDLLLGILIGIFLGVLSFIFIFADDTILNKKQQWAVTIGAFINIAWALMRGQWI